MFRPRQVTAEAGAVAAGGRALFHVAQSGAGLGTGLAYLGAQGGKAGVKLALLSQRIGGEGANGGAIQHQAQMLGPGMRAALFQAVGQRHGVADGMAVLKGFDSVPGLLAQLVHDR